MTHIVFRWLYIRMIKLIHVGENFQGQGVSGLNSEVNILVVEDDEDLIIYYAV